MGNNPFIEPETREQHINLCAATIFKDSQEKGTRGIADYPDGPGLHAMTLTELGNEIHGEALDQAFYVTQFVRGLTAELAITATELNEALDDVEEADAQLERARELSRKLLRLIR